MNVLPPQSDNELFDAYTRVLQTSKVSQQNLTQIEKDIKRTFSAQNYFNDSENRKGYMRLQRLLQAISCYKDIGYVQGMNYIAASLLWHCEEDISYYIMMSLYESLEAYKNYTDNLSGIQCHVDEFYSQYLKYNCNEIYENLEEKDIIPQMLFPEWFVTLGTSIIPLRHHALIFYNLIKHGWYYLYNILQNYLRFLYPYFQNEDFGCTLLIIKNGKFEDGQLIDIDWERILGPG